MSADSSRTVLQVVAGALCDEAGRVLIAQRPAGKAEAGRWEFPGGKIAPGEAREEALRRELREELGVEVASGEAAWVMTLHHAYPDREVELSFFLIRRFSGQPVSLDGQSWVWVPPGELDRWDILEADRPFIDWLKKTAEKSPLN